MAELLAIIILLGVILPIPLGAGFADWMNEVNAPVALDQKYAEVAGFEYGTSAVYDTTGYKSYFFWYDNTDGTEAWQKHAVTMDATPKLIANNESTEGAGYNNTDTEAMDDWDNGFPYWEVYFNYTAMDAYADGLIRIVLELDSSDEEYDDAPNYVAAGGTGLLSEPEEDEDKEIVTVTLSAGGVVFYSETLATTSTGDVEADFIVDVNDLRQAIIADGPLSFFKLRVVGHDVRPIEMGDSGFYTYNAPKLFARDDGLYLAAMISTILAALGIFLVQPHYSLPVGTGKNRKRGY